MSDELTMMLATADGMTDDNLSAFVATLASQLPGRSFVPMLDSMEATPHLLAAAIGYKVTEYQQFSTEFDVDSFLDEIDFDIDTTTLTKAMERLDTLSACDVGRHEVPPNCDSVVYKYTESIKVRACVACDASHKIFLVRSPSGGSMKYGIGVKGSATRWHVTTADGPVTALTFSGNLRCQGRLEAIHEGRWEQVRRIPNFFAGI